ncbi:MAG: hypothetical protein JXB62_06390 [Pirellulales bacterium]|nr:hypothetical protein [Pirellulales bacterium]
MRRIGWLLLLLLGLGYLASEIPSVATPSGHADQLDWRRTRDGWQRRVWAERPVAEDQPILHPAVVGLLELFLALAALIAFATDHSGREPNGATSARRQAKRKSIFRRGPK